MTLLFVYGTLKSDGRANHFMQSGQLLGEAVTEPSFQLYSAGWFPIMKSVSDGIAIEGELWELPENVISRIDSYEGSGFRKNIIKLQEPYRGKTVLAYLYKDSVGDLPEIGHKWEN